MRRLMMIVGSVVVLSVGCADAPSARSVCETELASPNLCTPPCADAMATAGATECADEVAALVGMDDYVAFRTCLDECAIVRDCMGVGAGVIDCDCLERCAEAASQELHDALTANMRCFERASATECL